MPIGVLDLAALIILAVIVASVRALVLGGWRGLIDFWRGQRN